MNKANPTIGLLALQGDYELHEIQLNNLGLKHKRVRLPSDFEGIDALIFPGGESTTMNILIDRFQMREPLIDFSKSFPIYGTCAGMILLSKEIEGNQAGVKPLGLIDITVLRNGYGRQLFSFEADIDVELGNSTEKVHASFIRAPKVTRVGAGVEILARYNDEPVMVSSGNILAASFHSETEDNSSLLAWFIRKFL